MSLTDTACYFKNLWTARAPMPPRMPDYRMMRLETGVVMGLPLRETRIGALSSACGRRARFANAQALLAISAMLNPAQRAHGYNPKPA